MNNSKPILLYIKTHNTTGLKYFGKTTGNPFKYKGSGKYWKRHLKKHGYDVTTEIFAVCFSEQESKSIAEKFSIDNSIVESKLWANFKIENGQDGGFSHLNDGSSQHRLRCSAAGKRVHEIHKNLYKENFSKRTSAAAIKTAETKRKKYGADYFQKLGAPGKPKSEEHKRKISDSLRNNPNFSNIYISVECPHCKISGSRNIMKRWHFDNCKQLSINKTRG